MMPVEIRMEGQPLINLQSPTGKMKGNNRTQMPATPRGSIFSNFEYIQLSTEERLYLHAARLGDIFLLREILEGDSKKLNYNCVDYMGRNALHLAVDSENVEAIEMLMECVNLECIEEALLHAISKSQLNIVRLIVDHPVYMTGEKQAKPIGKKDAFFRTEEKYQYPPDITPLILAAHKNDHEIIQLFLSRGYTIDRPHAIHCQCEDCLIKQNCDSLKRSRSRLNAYKALASPAYMALSSPDPITTTFELRQEMMQVAQVEKEFKNEYISMVEVCMDFACELMDLCRGTQEVEAVLGEESGESRDPLARLRLAINYDEKKFVSHPNCQQHLTNIWYGTEMGFFQSLSPYKKFLFILIFVPTLPFLCIAYIIYPYNKVGAALRCPITKFLTHTTSHFIFLLLLAVATFGLEEVIYVKDRSHHQFTNDTWLHDSKYQQAVYDLRPARSFITNVQILIIFWIMGLIWIECKQIYHSGAREHFQQYYNYMDFGILALYLASYSLRFAVQYRISEADNYLKVTERARDALSLKDMNAYNDIIQEAMDENLHPEYYYFVAASRFRWSPRDPEIVSDILFAVANVLSFARTTYVMPSHELLGPLQISLGRMMSDITRFVVLFLLVLFSFMVGMTNLYRYYGTHISKDENKPASESFKGMSETVHTLFFSIFGLIPLDKLKIDVPKSNTDNNEESTEMVDQVGQLLFAIYQIAVTIVLVNMLIAMMSHSFEAIQGDNDMEWKFARTKLWLNYIDEGSTLPVPFNMIPTTKSFRYALQFFKDISQDDEEGPVNYDFKSRRQNVIFDDLESAGIFLSKKTTYADIIQRLVRRYLFKLDREKAENEKIHMDSKALDADDEDLEDEDSSHLLHLAKPKESHLSVEPTVPPPVPQPYEVMRQSTRRATMRRSRKGSSANKVPPNEKLEAIKRGQKMLDARLADLQTLSRNEETNIKDNVEHMRQLLGESHKAMGSMVLAMKSMQEEMHTMSVHLCDFVNKQCNQKSSNKGDRSPAARATHHQKSGSTFAGMPPPPMFVGLATMPVASTSTDKGATHAAAAAGASAGGGKRRIGNTIKLSLRRKKQPVSKTTLSNPPSEI